jgi:uncharacterized protein (TIGR02246 family)
MKCLPGLAALLVLCMLPVSPSGAQTLSAPDRAAIQNLIMAVPAAMNRKDWRAFSGLFAEDADWINVVGMFWRGKGNVVKAHAAYASTAFRNGGFSYSDMLIRGVAPSVAVVVVTEHSIAQLAPDGTPLPGGQGRLSYLVVKRNGLWKITFGHNTAVNPDAQRYDPIGGHWRPASQR